ncbi:MAG: pdxH [Rhodospirillales bacterium]|nr:pdxH [Rhodospirillales bacterium]
MNELPTRNPIDVFQEWLAEAIASEPNDPTAMCLATADAGGNPSARMVLLKGIDQRGFAFYTNFESRKGRELVVRPRAALCFHWKSLRKQVRVEGRIEPVPSDEADLYFATRTRVSQIGAWASDQSRPLDSRATLEARVAEIEARYEGHPVPRPPNWSGYRVVPEAIEFWKDGLYRLHDRIRFSRSGLEWLTERLYP